MKFINKIVLLNTIVVFLVMVLNVFISFKDGTSILSLKIIYYLLLLTLFIIFLVKQKLLYFIVIYNLFFWFVYLTIRVLVLDKAYISYYNHPVIEYTYVFVDILRIKGFFSKIFVTIPFLINFLMSLSLFFYFLKKKSQ